MEITVRVEVQYLAPVGARLVDVLDVFRRPLWVRFMMRYITPRLKRASPTDKAVLDDLATAASAAAAAATSTHRDHGEPRSACVICMVDAHSGPVADPAPDAQAIAHVRLPCGHAFHFACIERWLESHSTCPICRFQLPRAFAGSYAVHSLASTVLLDPAHAAFPQEAILRMPVGNEVVRAVVHVTLRRVSDSIDKPGEYPCELSAVVMHANGEVFSDLPDESSVGPASDPAVPQSPTAAGASPSERTRRAAAGDKRRRGEGRVDDATEEELDLADDDEDDDRNHTCHLCAGELAGGEAGARPRQPLRDEVGDGNGQQQEQGQDREEEQEDHGQGRKRARRS